MRKRLSRPILVAFVLVLSIWYPTRVDSQVPSKVPNVMHKFSVEEIGKTVVLIGRLGMPLGEKMEIAGYWHMPKRDQKDGSIRFIVTTVNRKQLANPVEFSHEQVQFMDANHHNVVPEFKSQPALDGQRWTLTAYETGRIQITPDEYYSKSPVFPVVQVPYYTRPFTSELVSVVMRQESQK